MPVTEGLPRNRDITFAGTYHLKDHLCSTTFVQARLLIQCFLLLHLLLLEEVIWKDQPLQGSHSSLLPMFSLGKCNVARYAESESFIAYEKQCI